MAEEIKVAVIPGDGIGKEVMPEGIRVLESAGRKHDLQFDWKELRLVLRDLSEDRAHDA